MHSYILTNIQYIGVESNCPGVSNRERLHFYRLKSRKDACPPYPCAHWFCVIFNRCISIVPVPFLSHILVFNLPLH